MKLSYNQRLFGIITLIFAVFSIFIILFERKQEEKYRSEALESKLESYVDVLYDFIVSSELDITSMDRVKELASILPDSIRITIIEETGEVLYDNDYSNVSELDNHTDRPEIRKAFSQDYGSNIRMSSTANQEYMYYAKFFQPYFIRVALPYNIHTKGMLQADNWFVYVVIALFIIVLLVVYYVAQRFSQSIARLKDFTIRIKENMPLPQNSEFPDDELGDIGKDLVTIFNQKEKAKQDIEMEQEKLIQHFQHSSMGICMFSAERKKVFVNTQFMQYVNLIVEDPILDVDTIFSQSAFTPVREFITNKHNSDTHFSFQLEANGKKFNLQTILFEDHSFEVTITDITKIEKNRLLKQEMTNNIAHELRTPVTSLRGYLETLNEQKLPDDKKQQFIQRAYQQVVRLSNLIEDVSIISNMEERPGKYKMENINLYQLVNEVRIDLMDKLNNNEIKLYISIDKNLEIHGNYTLLFSIFRNLMDNSICYAGPGIEIHIDNYLQDQEYVYFAYYDTGSGVDEEHLNRLFERFYRIHEGRTRNNGGSGLGLSIVKNAVLLHKGNIHARNREGAGLEFLFTLKK